MKKNILALLLIAATLLTASCSGDDAAPVQEPTTENPNTENPDTENPEEETPDPVETPNGYSFNDTFYPLEFVNVSTYTSASTTMIGLSNVDFNEDAESGIEFINFIIYNSNTLQPGTYNIDAYYVYHNANRIDNLLTPGNLYFHHIHDQYKASNLYFRIKSISIDKIELEFTMTRQADGAVLTGNYIGSYTKSQS